MWEISRNRSKKHSVTRNCSEIVWKNCSSVLKNFANSRLSASTFSRSQEQFFLTVCQNNFGNKIQFFILSFFTVVASGPSSTGQSAGSNANHVLLKDVGHLVRENVVGVPSGFTKLGHPLLYFPDDPDGQNGLEMNKLLTMSEADLHLLFKYYLAVVPR